MKSTKIGVLYQYGYTDITKNRDPYLVNQNGVEDLSREVMDTSREVVVTGMDESLLASREKFVREEVHHLVNEGSPPYYRGARGVP